MKNFDVIIVGAGISGLTAAHYLNQANVKVKVFEAGEEVGGRVRTLEKEGFKLDRGFQVFLPAYPEAKRILDYEALDLRYFTNGALIQDGKQTYPLVDPFQSPKYLFKTAFSPLGLVDKLKLFALRQALLSKNIEGVLSANETTTRDKLKKGKYSIKLLRHFFQPFLAGIFFEKELETSSRMFEFVVKMFNQGGAALPASGISAIPKQIANNLPAGTIETGKKVISLSGAGVGLENGDRFSADVVLIATEANCELLKPYESKIKSEYKSVHVLYFDAKEIPSKEPLLILNANSETSLINNLCFVSNVVPELAPKDKHLLSVTVLDWSGKYDDLVFETHKELKLMYGTPAEHWRFLHHEFIPYALPNQDKIKSKRLKKEVRLDERLYIAGDHRLYGSLNAAMQSGREAAETIIFDLKKS